MALLYCGTAPGPANRHDVHPAVIEFLPQGFTPFAQISVISAGTIGLIYFLSFLVRGTFGFGSGVPAVLFGSYLLDPHHAVLLLLCCSVVSHAQFIWHGVRFADWGVAKVILVFLIPGAIGGVWVFRELSAAWLTLVLGIVISVIVAISFTDVINRLTTRMDIRSPWIGGILATCSGWIVGCIGVGGNYLMGAYLRHACPTAQKLRATGFTVSTVSLLGRLGIVWVAGLLSPQLFAEMIVLAPVVLLGGWTGARFFRALPGERFDLVFRVFLLLVSISVVAKGIAQVV